MMADALLQRPVSGHGQDIQKQQDVSMSRPAAVTLEAPS
jgi:hypothetical protein